MPTPTVVRRRRAIKAAAGLLVFSLIGAVVVRLYLLQTAPPSPEEVAGLTLQEAEISKMVNDERQRAGRKPLKFSARLAVVARGHSYDMAMRHYLCMAAPKEPAWLIASAGSGLATRRRSPRTSIWTTTASPTPGRARDRGMAQERDASREHALRQVHRDRSWSCALLRRQLLRDPGFHSLGRQLKPAAIVVGTRA